jgi:ABC-type transport system involved in cytochrome c biogenesis permease component
MHGLYVAIFICGTVTLSMLGATLATLAEQRTKQMELLLQSQKLGRTAN